MSRFFSERYADLVPYTPGEQPRDRSYVKLNTNESPFSPPPSVTEAAAKACGESRLYSDPECIDLRAEMSRAFGVAANRIVMVNGSDEALNFAFMAFADEKHPLAFADITYGFYPVFADLNHIPYEEIPLAADFSIDPKDYIGIRKTVVIANPNAPTGRTMPLSDIAAIAESNPDNVVIVDEAYVDFGGESAVSLLDRFENLLVVGTFSKSRSLAGGRLGFAMGSEALCADLNTIRYSTNPYNVNRMSAAAGIAALREQAYFDDCCRTIMENRAWTAAELEKLGFSVLPSCANFLFAQSPDIDGENLYIELKQRGVLIRHFTKARIANFNRITIGTREQMEILIREIRNILEGRT